MKPDVGYFGVGIAPPAEDGISAARLGGSHPEEQFIQLECPAQAPMIWHLSVQLLPMSAAHILLHSPEAIFSS